MLKNDMLCYTVWFFFKDLLMKLWGTLGMMHMLCGYSKKQKLGIMISEATLYTSHSACIKN